jgi:tetratricopeptide (TPR) repeat protein
MAVGSTMSSRLRRSGFRCVAVCLVAALISPSSWAAEARAPQVPAPEKEQPTVSGPAGSSSEEHEIRSVREQIAKTPDDALLYVRLGYLLLNAGAPADAKTAFDDALKRNNHSHAALTGEGIILARAGNLKEAEQVLKEALVRNPDPVRTLYELGLVYEKEGDPEKALAEYKEGIAKYQQGRK